MYYVYYKNFNYDVLFLLLLLVSKTGVNITFL